MKIFTNIIKFILIMVLTMCLIFIGIISIASSTILDKGYILQKLEETNFYEETHNLAESNFENYIYQSGLDEDVLENICSKEKVEKDIKTMISNIYDGTEQKIDTTEIAQNLNNNIEKKGIKNSKNEKAIDTFVEHICNEYTETLIHTKYETKINDYLVKGTKLIGKAYNGILILTAVIIVMLIIINIKQISKLVLATGIALLASGAFNLIAHDIIISKVNIENIKIFNDTFSKSIVSIITDILSKISSLSMGMLIISIIFIVIYAMTEAYKKQKDEREESK